MDRQMKHFVTIWCNGNQQREPCLNYRWNTHFTDIKKRIHLKKQNSYVLRKTTALKYVTLHTPSYLHKGGKYFFVFKKLNYYTLMPPPNCSVQLLLKTKKCNYVQTKSISQVFTSNMQVGRFFTRKKEKKKSCYDNKWF